MPDPHLRAADSDRAAVAATLGRAMSEGRLTVAEYDERLAAAYAARTFGELAPLTADLPRGTAASPARPAPAAAPTVAAGPVCTANRGGHGWPAWGSWSSTALIVLFIWAATCVAAQEFLYFWPFWVIVPWGAMLLIGTVGARSRRSDRRLPT
ncbi:DUF1707 SHOCT-like domain-containing protein [Blastococcus saxobsidens]|uniref:Cyclic nucleotide-binding domain-containing protein n=1 Tax=Blastococcus saxobsidens (strain DD2) TaxID=1146883 RepID=H6RJD5_BLASD|nr:DUF1707 domain-containing protein [Blastococcus saxobsidens]CCG01048.1 conserved protein of unknown function; putative Cyclic nucleotide-binding domain [Blastococcus saxobsidens DD2]